jgi:hypothetical protein
MRALFRLLCISLLIGLHAEPSMAQPIRQQASSNFAPDEIVAAGTRFTGRAPRLAGTSEAMAPRR